MTVTPSHHSDSAPTSLEGEARGFTRRQVTTAAAWAAPVIALAVATPLAAASADSATVEAQVGGSITANRDAGTATGSFTTAGVIISNVVGTWDTGALTGQYGLTGPWNTTTITKADGSPFVQGESITSGGTVWTVVSILQDANGVYEVHFTGASVTVSSNTVINMPPAIYSGTFTSNVPSTRNPIGGTVRVAAANVNDGSTVSNSSNFP